MSENITVRSIAGRYLEHSRLYAFEIGDETELFLGSADLMTRNLDRRVEVLVPVEQPRLRQELTAVFDSASPTSRRPGSSPPTGRGRAATREGRARAQPPAEPAAARSPALAPARGGARSAVDEAGGLTGVLARMTGMRVGVIDVGSNTVRLLVASVAGGAVRTVREEREHLGLGEEILRHGRVRRREARRAGRGRPRLRPDRAQARRRELETVVTAPGRQGDSPERLLDTLGRATGAEVRIVSAEEEGRLAFAGAVSRADIR